ncbi:MAG: GIY-YIG nuclease family protein [Bacteroidota bacterium]
MKYLYILKSEAEGGFYFGISDDPAAKLKEHNTLESVDMYTSKHRPWKMVALFEVSEGRLSPAQIITFLKKHQTEKLMENLITPGFIPEGKLQQLVRVEVKN